MATVGYTGLAGLGQASGTIIPDATQRVQATPDAFGGSEATSVGQIGKGLQQAGLAGVDVGIYQQKLHDQTAVTEALNNLQEKARSVQFGSGSADPSDVGYYGTKGRSALDAYAGSVAQVTDQQKAIREGLQTDQQRALFDARARGYMNSLQTTMLTHRDQQAVQWSSDTETARATNSLKDSTLFFNDDAAFSGHLGDAEAAIARRNQILGKPPEQTTADVRALRDKAWSDRAMRVAVDDPIAAQRLIENNIGALDAGTATSLLDRLRPQVEKKTAQGIVDAVTGRYGGGAADAAGMATGGDPAQPRGLRNNNPLNLSYVSGQTGVIGSDGRFGQYGSMEDGISASVAQMRLYQSRDGLKTPRDIIGKWAPASDGNNQATYLRTVARVSGLDVDKPIDLSDPAQAAKLVRGMAKVETGRDLDQDVALRGAQGKGGSSGAKLIPMGGLRGGSADRGGGDPAPVGPPNLDDMLSRAEPMLQGQSPEVQDRVRSGIVSTYNQQMARTHGLRTSLSKQAGDVNAALADGRDVQPLDENAIRSAFPAEAADKMVEGQRLAQAQGQVMNGIAYASPADIAKLSADLESGVGVHSDALRRRMGTKLAQAPAVPVDPNVPIVPLDPAATVPPPATINPNSDAADYRLRRTYAASVQTALARRNENLLRDPAAFAASNPALASVTAAANDPQAPPEQRAAAVQAVLAEQERLGVPEAKRSALPVQQVQGLVQQLVHTDPSKADMGTQLQGLAQSYGSAWPDVFGSMVRVGSLPTGYQALAVMDRPEQTPDRVDMQRALSVVAEKKGLKELRESVPPDAAKEIDKGLDEKMGEFRSTIANDQNAVKLYDTFRDSVKTLAYYRAMRGDSDPLGSAYEGVLGKRYDFDGTMRAPKGQMDAVREATRGVVAGLKPEDIAAIGGNERMSDPERRAEMLTSVKGNGFWVPMADDGGLQLVTSTRNSKVPTAVNRADGSPITVRFNALPAPDRTITKMVAPAGVLN